MKKVISILAACMMVVALAGMASAAPEQPVCTTCEVNEPGTISVPQFCDPVLEQGQTCVPKIFDYESYGQTQDENCNDNSYCEIGAKGDLHRALLNICKCIPDPFDTVQVGDVMDITMTIKVTDTNGAEVSNGGVYWYEDVQDNGGVKVRTFNSAPEACDLPCTEDIGDRRFEGDFQYVNVAGDTTDDPQFTATCDIPEANEYITIKSANRSDGQGFIIGQGDADNLNSTWWIDIPKMVVDPSTAVEGSDVFVEICVTDEAFNSSICTDCICCCEIYIGKLGCCATPSTPGGECSDTLTFPYIPSPAGNYWFGMAVTNLTDEAGTAAVTWYEADGDVATGTVTLDANTPNIINLSDLTLTTSVEGTLGNAQAYAVVVTDVAASGFGFMANDKSKGESMGYLAEKCAGCDPCYSFPYMQAY